MDENPAYETKATLRREEYENPLEPSYEIIPPVSRQSATQVYSNLADMEREVQMNTITTR